MLRSTWLLRCTLHAGAKALPGRHLFRQEQPRRSIAKWSHAPQKDNVIKPGLTEPAQDEQNIYIIKYAIRSGKTEDEIESTLADLKIPRSRELFLAMISAYLHIKKLTPAYALCLELEMTDMGPESLDALPLLCATYSEADRWERVSVVLRRARDAGIDTTEECIKMIQKAKEGQNIEALKNLVKIVPKNPTRPQLISIIFESLLLIAAESKKDVRIILDSFGKSQPEVLWAVSTEFVRLAATSQEHWSLLVEFRINDQLSSVAKWKDIIHPPVLIAFAYLVDNPGLARSYFKRAIAAQSPLTPVDEIFRRSVVFILSLSMINQCIHFLSTHLNLLDLPQQVKMILAALHEIGPGRAFALMTAYAAKIGERFPKDALAQVALAAVEADCAASPADEARVKSTFKKAIEVGVVDGTIFYAVYNFYMRMENEDAAAEVAELWAQSGTLVPMCSEIIWSSPRYHLLYDKMRACDLSPGQSSEPLFLAAAECVSGSEELLQEWVYWVGKGAAPTESSYISAIQSCRKRPAPTDLAMARQFAKSALLNENLPLSREFGRLIEERIATGAARGASSSSATATPTATTTERHLTQAERQQLLNIL